MVSFFTMSPGSAITDGESMNRLESASAATSAASTLGYSCDISRGIIMFLP